MVEGKVIFGVDTDVIHINFQLFFCYHVGKDVVHKGLECRWCVAKPEEHHCWFEESKGSDKGGFPLVFFMNVGVVKAPPDVKFREEDGIFHVIDEFWDEQQRVWISNGVGIEIPVVLAGA